MLMRIPFIAGNWKMHNNVAEALALVKKIHHGLPWPGEVDVVVAPTFTALDTIVANLKTSYINIAAQNLATEEEGAFTGEISAPMLKDIGIKYVIIGHSERRQYFGETNAAINKKIKLALKHDLMPIFCVGETLEQRESSLVQTIIQQQLLEGLEKLTATEIEPIIIAYEPVWAIGTGKTATPEQAEEVHQLIRTIITQQFGIPTAEKIRIIYGGSVKPSNCKTLLTQKNIDGALIGGASLKAEDFIAVINSIPAACCGNGS